MIYRGCNVDFFNFIKSVLNLFHISIGHMKVLSILLSSQEYLYLVSLCLKY